MMLRPSGLKTQTEGVGRHPLKQVPSSMTWSWISPVAGGLGCMLEHHRIRRVKSAFFLVSMRV
jgi:hypothetical protein